MFSSHSPSSSPPSSCIDSSPPQSPPLHPIVTHDYHIEADTPLVDPLAASVKTIWPLPQYERRSPGDPKKSKRVRVREVAQISPSTSPRSFKKMKYRYRVDNDLASSEQFFGSDYLNLHVRRRSDSLSVGDPMDSEPSREEQEFSIWEDACTTVFNGIGNIDLGNKNLTYIPRKFIEDLGKIYIPPDSLNRFQPTSTSSQDASRPFMRSITAPAGMGEPGSSLFQSDPRRIARANVERARTVAHVSLGLPRGQIALYLMKNQITSLPKELFSLQRLTVLSVRNNRLTHLPPEIKYLSSLHTLNIAYNQIRYLPSEMLQMSLEQLHVHPNPFLELPTSNATMHASPTGRPVSQPVRHLPRVIPLVEVCLRRLLSPTSSQESKTLLVSHYELPLAESSYYSLPVHLKGVIEACVPGSFYRLTTEKDAHGDGEMITGLGHCPSSQRRCTDGEARKSCGVFVSHAEERFTWESKVANVEIGARAPIRWRGCNWGCLEFLEGDDKDKNGDTEVIEAEDAVQLMDLSTGGLGFDE